MLSQWLAFIIIVVICGSDSGRYNFNLPKERGRERVKTGIWNQGYVENNEKKKENKDNRQAVWGREKKRLKHVIYELNWI